MSLFDIYPAIDLRHGRVVRLELGDPTRETVFGDDPAAAARRWRRRWPGSRTPSPRRRSVADRARRLS